MDEEPRSFSLEEAFLTRKNYKVIFCIAFIVAAFKVAFFMFFKWDLTEWWNYILFILTLILVFISVLLFLFIPVAFGVRIIFTVLLKEKIKQLDQEIWKRRKTAAQQNRA
ncbi:hypothetical membrane protein [Bartonella grahamii as4aup]|uniref:Hypothetical membrane protein n=1 Tax=Bartonella grahamii (strain as4aup) TaxID=634504 RepID=C6AAD9_BARGA|nr:hypothetical membrane protein [Bartonella grahamii as4aup]